MVQFVPNHWLTPRIPSIHPVDGGIPGLTKLSLHLRTLPGGLLQGPVA